VVLLEIDRARGEGVARPLQVCTSKASKASKAAAQ
jgi:hypothetical protein